MLIVHLPSESRPKHSHNSNLDLMSVSESEEEQENEDQEEDQPAQSFEWSSDESETKFHPPAIVGSLRSTPTPPLRGLCVAHQHHHCEQRPKLQRRGT